MPQTKAAKKALRQNEKQRAINRNKKRTLAETVKSFARTLQSGDISKAEALLPKTHKTIDKMAKVHLIKKGKADRIKSRLAKNLAKQKKN
jgi:small subunit ribosomal protein S20